jgi:hypothetical protein
VRTVSFTSLGHRNVGMRRVFTPAVEFGGWSYPTSRFTRAPALPCSM